MSIEVRKLKKMICTSNQLTHFHRKYLIRNGKHLTLREKPVLKYHTIRTVLRSPKRRTPLIQLIELAYLVVSSLNVNFE